MIRLLPPLLVLTMLTTAACRGPDLDEPVALQITTQLVDDSVALANARAELLCDCSERYGFTSWNECREYFDYLDEEEHECILAVFSTEPIASRDFLECTTGLAEELVECLEPMTCGGGLLVDACHESFYEGSAECPALPISMLAELRSCTE